MDWGMDRRRFLRLGLGGSALLLAQPALVRTAAQAQPAPGPFGHGVASGDPLADRVIIWTRVTPSDDATPGSGLGAPTLVEWEVATDPDFAAVVASGSVTTSPDSDHTVKVDVVGLAAYTDHWFRFRALGATSPVGRTRTAPAPGDTVPNLRFGVVACSNYEGGYFSTYRHLAARDDLDAVFHLGDYIYEGPRGSYGPGASFGRLNDPEHEIVSLEDYRRRHALYKSDPDLRALHQRYPFITTIDDHEVTDNAYGGGAGNHQPDEGDWATRKAAAMQAYFEWIPIRPPGGPSDPHRIYRHLSYGGLADVFVLDERTYRSRQLQGVREDMIVTSPEVADPDRSMLGAAQLEWFEDRLTASPAQWKIIANSVMFAPLVVADMPDILEAPEVGAILTTLFTTLGVSPPVVINGDQWDGYAAEQARLTRLYSHVGGVAILTGDIHSSWAAEIPVDAAGYLPLRTGDTAAVEFVTPATTSNSFSQSLESIGIPGAELLVPLLPTVVDVAGPWFKYVDGDRHGFGVFDVTPEAVQYDWLYISDRADPRATLHQGPSWRSPAGSNKLVAASPLGARTALQPDATEPPPGPTPPAVERAPSADVVGGQLPATGGSVPLVAAAAAAVGGAVAARVARVADSAGAPDGDERSC